MLDTKTACEILGVKEGAGRDEIIKRYDILLKKHKILGENDKETDIEEINRAYNVLMGYANEDPQEDKQEADELGSSIYKKVGLDKKKVSNFFYYHKYHVLVIIAALLLVSYIVYLFVSKVEPDLSVVIAGDIKIQESAKVKSNLKEKLPDIKELEFQYMYISKDGTSQEDQAYTYKISILMASGNVDVYIFDSEKYKKYAAMGAFKSLDSLAGQIGVDRAKNSKQIVKFPNNEEHLYGIDIGSSRLLKGMWLGENGKIAAIMANTKHYNNAVKLLKLLAEE